MPPADAPALEELKADGTLLERINRADLKPLYDTNHTCEYRPEADGEDTTAYMCIHCPRGYIVAKP